MTHPIFFSLAGQSDKALAEEVKSYFSDRLVFLYTRTGGEGENIYREIESEISNCVVFVVFWSEDYLASEYATWELAMFKKIHEGANSWKEVVIVPTAANGPNITSKWINPITQKRDEFALGKWRLERSVDENASPETIAELIKRRLNSAGCGANVLVARSHVQRLIQNAVSAPDYMAREIIFVSGAEGNGRRTAVRQYMESTYRHLTSKMLAFDSLDGPEDILPRLMQADGVTNANAKLVLSQISEGLTTAEKEIRKLLHGFRKSKSYLICAMDRFTAVDLSIWLPSWVPKLFGVFKDGPAPIIYFVSSFAVKESELKDHCSGGLVRVPGLEENEMTELVYRLATLDPNSSRWTKEKKGLVVSIAGSSPALAQLIMRKAIFEESLDYLEDLSKREEERFSAGLTAVLSSAVAGYRDSPADVIALFVIERLGLASRQAVDSIMEAQGAWDLHGFLELGLVERLSDDLLRIPPLIQRRLGYLLLNTDLASTAERLIIEFGGRQESSTDEFGPMFFANKAAASLRVGDGSTDPSLRYYVTLAMLARAGIERYGLEDWDGAHSVMSRAFDRLSGQHAVDLGVKIEIARYFGLSSARAGYRNDVDRACEYLSNELNGGRRAVQGQAMAHFLRGFDYRVQGRFDDALQFFKEADKLLSGVKYANRQHGAVLTELSRALLKLNKPKYDEAVDAAERAYQTMEVAHNLNALIRARIARLANTVQRSTAWKVEEAEIRGKIEELKVISRRIGREFDLVRLGELEMVVSLRDCEKSGGALDLSETIRQWTRALGIRSQPSTQALLWKAQILHESKDLTATVIAETSRVKQVAQEMSRRRDDAEILYVLARAKSSPHSATQLLQTVPWANGFFKRFLLDMSEGKLKKSTRLISIVERF